MQGFSLHLALHDLNFNVQFSILTELGQKYGSDSIYLSVYICIKKIFTNFSGIA